MAFCTAINCMDGRVQFPVLQFLKDRFDVDYVDTITEPGPNRILAEEADPVAVDSIMRRVGVSVNKHGSAAVAIVGHCDCAGNPVGEAEQAEQTAAAVDFVQARYPKVTVIGLWVDRNWQVSEL